jgi:hypothetical protein
MQFDSLFLFSYFQLALECPAAVPNAIFRHLSNDNQTQMSVVSCIRTVGISLLLRLQEIDPPFDIHQTPGSRESCWNNGGYHRFSIRLKRDQVKFAHQIDNFNHTSTFCVDTAELRLESFFQLDALIRYFQRRCVELLPYGRLSPRGYYIQHPSPVFDPHEYDALSINIFDSELYINGEECTTPQDCDVLLRNTIHKKQ